MDELLKQLATLGIGGVIAAILLWYSRNDRNELKDLVTRLFGVIEENTKSNTVLAELVKEIHVHMVYQEKLKDRRDSSRRHEA